MGYSSVHEFMQQRVLVHPHLGVDGYGVGTWVERTSLTPFNWPNDNLSAKIECFDLIKDLLYNFTLN
jgi:hypothetical protein